MTPEQIMFVRPKTEFSSVDKSKRSVRHVSITATYVSDTPDWK